MKSDEDRTCTACSAERMAARQNTQKVCSKCGAAKAESEYKTKKEYMKSGQDRKCNACSGKRRGFWTCVKCKKAEPIDAFSKWLEQRKLKYNNGTARRNACKTQEEEEERKVR